MPAQSARIVSHKKSYSKHWKMRTNQAGKQIGFIGCYIQTVRSLIPYLSANWTTDIYSMIQILLLSASFYSNSRINIRVFADNGKKGRFKSDYLPRRKPWFSWVSKLYIFVLSYLWHTAFIRLQCHCQHVAVSLSGYWQWDRSRMMDWWKLALWCISPYTLHKMAPIHWKWE